VIADFRPADIAVGGQGAPLVPFADFALFASPTETRAVQNIGGIANVTYLEADRTLDDVIAFDTGPGNVLIDAVVSLRWRDLTYDPNGMIAAQGQVHLPLLEWLLDHTFLQQAPPRTTGREQFGRELAEWLLNVFRSDSLTSQDYVATVTQFTAQSIANAYHEWLEPYSKIQTVIVGGGGAKNSTLMRMLQDALGHVTLKTHEDFGISSDAKRPAILGKMTLPPL
jgi:anhydro-N-acetylmuramic acid kinase